MKTVTVAAFVELMEKGHLEWPPFSLGQYVYSRRVNREAEEDPIGEIVRAEVTA